MPTPTIGQPAPALKVNTLGGERFELSNRSPDSFTMVVFYRGLHCPVCKVYTEELVAKHKEFERRGVEVIAVSCDEKARAQDSQQDWQLGALPVGYGLDIETARAWGLYISSAIKDEEPAQFCEPGLFLVRSDGSLFYAAINSMPFGRPDLGDMLEAIDFVENKGYPARGTA